MPECFVSKCNASICKIVLINILFCNAIFTKGQGRPEKDALNTVNFKNNELRKEVDLKYKGLIKKHFLMQGKQTQKRMLKNQRMLK